MKKLAFMFVAVMALSFVSCDEKKAEVPAEGTEVVDTTATDTTAADTAAADTAAADTAAAAAE